jgi:hypothetical protein
MQMHQQRLGQLSASKVSFYEFHSASSEHPSAQIAIKNTRLAVMPNENVIKKAEVCLVADTPIGCPNLTSQPNFFFNSEPLLVLVNFFHQHPPKKIEPRFVSSKFAGPFPW